MAEVRYPWVLHAPRFLHLALQRPHVQLRGLWLLVAALHGSRCLPGADWSERATRRQPRGDLEISRSERCGKMSEEVVVALTLS